MRQKRELGLVSASRGGVAAPAGGFQSPSFLNTIRTPFGAFSKASMAPKFSRTTMPDSRKAADGRVAGLGVKLALLSRAVHDH
jgi:hypothetical protein